MWDLTPVGEGNETFFIRVWEPLPSRRVLKTLRWSPKRKAQRGQYLLTNGIRARHRAVCLWGRWGSKEVDTGQCASEDGEPWREWTSGDVSARTLGPEGECIVRSHIDWREERVPARTLGLKGVDCEIPRRFHPSRRVLKILRENPKEKTQRGQYLLAVDLDCYT